MSRTNFEFQTPTFSRDDSKTINENILIFHYLADQLDDGKRTMLDVGAHFGGSMMRFLQTGWDVWAFEPDPQNRVRLFERLRDQQTMPRRVDHRAVSNTSGTELEFYRSPVSAGISSLSRFHPTHEVALKVQTVTLRDFMRDYEVESVDYLKIDVEGHDLFVLEGFPFDKVRPRAVLCEYEDRKTVPLGHDSKKIADFLCQNGYHVYFSEWHPIIEYGTPHDWSCLRSYDGAAAPEEGWGNLVAFSDKPSAEAMRRLVDLSVNTKPAKSVPAPGKQTPSGDLGGSVNSERLTYDAAQIERVVENLHTLFGVVEGHSKILNRIQRTLDGVDLETNAP